MTAHDYLKAIREKANLTQVEIAKRTGIPQPTVSKIERGKVNDVLSSTLQKLQALHDELFPESR